MELIKDVQKKVTFGKDSFKIFKDHDQYYNIEHGKPAVTVDKDKKIVKKYLPQAVMVDKTLYISGQLGMGKDGSIVGGGTLAQVCFNLNFNISK